jgi:hypothetical protein
MMEVKKNVGILGGIEDFYFENMTDQERKKKLASIRLKKALAFWVI